ncbi:BRCT domain-containing protein [Microbulbifer agarilyticus]
MHNEGYEFIDIGADNSSNRSPFYLAEKKRIEEIGAKVHNAPSKRVTEARAGAPESSRPPSKSMKQCKESGFI